MYVNVGTRENAFTHFELKRKRKTIGFQSQNLSTEGE